MSLTRFAALLAIAGCTARGTPEAPAATPEAPPTATPTTSAQAEPAPSASEAVKPEVPERELGAFSRVLDQPVHSIAFGKGASVAALGQEAFVDRGKGFEKLPKLPRPSEHVSIYFGRDDQPRAMGYEDAGGEKKPVYLRFRGGAWQNGASEIAKLGSPSPGALFGVLGWDDPEVVCKERELCIIKRLTGWTMIPVIDHADVVLCGKEAFAYAGKQAWKLAPKSFEPFSGEPSFQQADALWAREDGVVWVAEHATSSVHRHDGKIWKREPSPIAGPRSVWASGPSDLWLAGDGGLAHFDGKSWARVKGAPEKIVLVTGKSGGAPWLAASSGVFVRR